MDHWNGRRIAAGEARDVTLAISESYSGMTMEIPVHIRRARADGPVVFVTAAMHGDEINGTGAIRRLLQDDAFQLVRGALILVPVLNLPGFDRHSRYLPDRRDLNRCFPGSLTGSLASRMAHAIFNSIVMPSDYGIDLHTAAVRRTNYPNVRGDLAFPAVRQLAEAFGSEIIVNSQGPQKALRPEACAAGCPTIMMEGGEVWKVEPAIVAATVRGVRNVLGHLGMLDETPLRPEYQVVIEKTRWVRAERGGFLEFHVAPGQIVDRGQPLATSATLLGRERRVLHSPFDAVVVGMTTLPAVSPGEPICNLGRLPDGTRPDQLRQLRARTSGLGRPTADDLADVLPAASQTPPSSPQPERPA
ncbi:MAG: succinylglutamate desuccinylase/aspartoacylase family protein [Thermoguttaceae bacterium]